MTIAGSLLANGAAGNLYGAGSGGGIWLTCRKLALTDTAVITAKGGNPGTYNATEAPARPSSSRPCMA